MKSINFSLLLLGLIIFYSCKKDKKIETPILPEQIKPYQPDKLNGELINTKVFYIVNNSLILAGGNSSAQFSDSLVENFLTPYHLTSVGKVGLNSIFLKEYQFGNNNTSYIDTINTVVDSPIIWTIEGSPSFPSFVYNDSISFPTYEGLKNLPSTLFLSSDTIINITDYKADEVIVSIENGGAKLSRTITSPVTLIKLTTSDYLDLKTEQTATGLLRLEFYKKIYKKFGNKIYRFKTGIMVIKQNFRLIPCNYSFKETNSVCFDWGI